ncbi:hypothetical protein TorRG33x02_092510 [Trema orientale]|uniref:Uncharacterized protein n=1 Tax=Trema orientale TaxID=63057 RepID=A0A2P5FB84_TREOI|nr:hypothetical protein TorRG33x02_092510 [Trema orientale]
MRFGFQTRASGRVSGRVHVKSTKPKPSLKDNRVRAELGPCRVQAEFESGFFRASPSDFGLSGSFYIPREREHQGHLGAHQLANSRVPTQHLNG